MLLRGRDRQKPLVRREEEFISGLAGNYSDDVVLNRQDVSDFAHINDVLCSSTYDIIHFSGRRDSDDIYLESSFIHQQLAILDADRCLHALESAPRLPKLVVFMPCFSRQHANVLARCAPFVIRTDLSVGDEERVAFVEHFYAKWVSTTVRRQRRFGCERGRCQRTNPGSRLCCAEARTDFPFSHLLDRPYASRSEHA